MKKKTLKIVLSLMVGLFSVYLFFPSIRVFFFEPLHAWQGREGTLGEVFTGSSFEESLEDQEELVVSFLEEIQQAYVGEVFPIMFLTNRPLTSIDIQLPAATIIEETFLMEEIVITQTEDPEQWLLNSEVPLTSFSLPLTIESVGTYEITVAETVLTLNVEERKSGDEGERPPMETDDHPIGTNLAADPVKSDGSFFDDIEVDEGNLDLLEDRRREQEVGSWLEFLEAVMDPEVNHIKLIDSFESSDNPIEGIASGVSGSTINISSGDSYVYISQPGISRTLIIDGQGKYQIDFRAVAVGFLDSTMVPESPWDISYQNITLYHGNYYGPMNVTTLGVNNQAISTMRYHNVENIGNQLLHSVGTTAVLSGKVTSHQARSYRSTFNENWQINAWNQANFEVHRLLISPNAEVELSTISSGNLFYHGLNHPELVIGENAKVSMKANFEGTRGEADGVNVYFGNGGGNLTVGKGAELKLDTQINASAISTLHGNHTIDLLEDSKVHIQSLENRSHTNGWNWNILSFQGGNTHINLKERSMLKIDAENQPNLSAHVVGFWEPQNSITVGKDAILDIRSDSRNDSQNLIFFGNLSKLTFNEARKVNLERTAPLSFNNGSLINLNGTNELEIEFQGIKQWQYGEFDEVQSTHEWMPLIHMSTNLTWINPTINSVVTLDPTVEQGVRSHFSTHSQRLLFEQVSEVEIELNPLTEDPTLSNSRIISGRANPNSYIRFEREAFMPEPNPSLGTVTDPDGRREFFHVQADEEGNFQFDLSEFPNFQHFRHEELVTAEAFLNGRWGKDSVIVEKIDIVDPRDPFRPDETVDPVNPPVLPENQGFVSIDFISQFDFGEVPILSSTTRYPAKPQALREVYEDVHEGDRPNYIQVSDRRVATTGWTLSARLSEEGFVGTHDERQRLRGASVYLSNIHMVTTGSNESETPDYQEAIELIAGQSKTLASAQENHGGGTWIQHYGSSETMENSVELEVPIGANPQATAYRGTIYWELSFVPRPES
ncbi:WxL domain-containing protein [Enterococcus casseliflavus]|jgi:hypothetical protein|uniref:WxL domain-containing protein n=1 Tax=Enterococcus TaxID=1350 RepID=UPI0003601C49|nr:MULTISPECIES: WxL domain-containing protein [unclassified Enterococcus]EPH68092.1 hypothetical protein D931_00084 [Enterococcus faecium 13.SD.W.09]MBE9894335.1 WxL domain-containing protein [Enterococcus casseliflavus]MBO1097036.1 WxL domain-containing protein [Enterococcus casseliflavus]MBO1120861.1 WxL domain-containing protein [Enterococcus casseliflavus]MBO1146093.1 WxL domain-containing protein [Enterococcus casseliflavus]